MSDIVNERGWFWWANRKVGPRSNIADDHVGGTLRVDNDGNITLELDGILSDNSGFIFLSDGSIPENAIIRGYLKNNKYIAIHGLYRSGGTWDSNGNSHETISAETCILSDRRIPSSIKAKSIEIPLTGIDEWVGRLPMNFKRKSNSLIATFLRLKDYKFATDAGKVSIKSTTYVNEVGGFSDRRITAYPIHTISYQPVELFHARESQKYHYRIMDIFMLLTDSDYILDFPTLTLSNNTKASVYFFRPLHKVSPPKRHSIAVPLPRIESEFGIIFSKWMKGFESVGPGFFLYTSTRRIERMYTENRFTTLIAGLEALHRHKFPTEEDSSLRARMDRILQSITDTKDRKWLEKRMRRFSEPNLSDRLYALFKDIPTQIEPKTMKRYCEFYAGCRNKISHTGGHSELEFPTEAPLYDHVRVVGFLYHAKILLDIGVPLDAVDQWLNNIPTSFQINHYMVSTGIRKHKPLDD